ncbi:hypothetical protein [Stenotrophomonas indicatrix]|uniref:hypothetical protein n=1 Tax=Stenotrophomonas indicatrix TaxID=2045451 RepID=UPI0008CCBE0D|nr:hypothetical protein [Stenotrophomonas indicatrix]SET91210.1 hypothetical protein SAMN05720615_109206 [Stenotrophomonas indicatrix]SEU12824.1 hypothetical protein SAMN05720615_11842 [Stenotrophomonas indicatrix]
MADIFDSYARGLQVGQQQKQRNQLAELQTLAPQVMGGNLDATSRAYALDPQTAQAYQTEGNRQQQQLVGLAKTLKQFANNPQMQAGVYRSALPYLKRNFGAEIPDDFDAASVMPIVDQVLAVANNTPNFNGQTPTDVRSFQMMTQGLTPEEVERARRINLGLDGRASTSGFSQVKFAGADGRERVGVLNGRTGQIDLPDGTSFNPQTGAMSQTAPQAQQAVPAAGLYNTPNGQVRIGEGLTPEQWQLVQADMANGGASNNYQLPDRNVTPAQRAASGGVFVGRAPEEQAALTEAAKLGVQQQYLPQELAARTQAALAQEAGKAQVTAQADANKLQTTRTRDANTALDLLDEAETLLNGGATGSLIGAGVDRLAGAVGQSTRGAQATAALRTIAGQLTSKMPRMEGPQSDKDVQLYKEMAGDLANDALPVPTRVAALRQIRELNSKYANRQDRPSAPRQIQSAAEYNALPSGALFIAPDGTQRRKR